MTKFVGLYMASAEQIAEWNAAPPEDAASDMADWMAWAEKERESIVELGSPLGKTVRVTTEGTSEAKNQVVGYTIVEAASHADAAKVFAGNPFIASDKTWIEVMDCVALPGMENT